MAGLMILVSVFAAGAFAKRIATKHDTVQLQKEAVANGPRILPSSVQSALPASVMMAPVQSFVAQPLVSSHATRASALSMSLAPMDRRAALSGAATSLLWGAQAAAAASTLAADKAELSLEESKLEEEDVELAKLRRQELSDEVALTKAQDAVLDAMAAKKDKAEIAKLQAKVVELKKKEDADEGKEKKLYDEVRKEASKVSAEKAKVATDVAKEVVEENKELLEAEEGELKTVVGKDTAGFVSKFFKQ